MTNERKGFSGETLFGGKNSLLATEKVRKLLSKPPKRILTGREFIEKIKAGKSKLICVGDMVTLTAINGGVVPSLAVFDGKTERNKINVKTINRTYDKKIIKVKNPPGEISRALYLSVLKTIDKEGYAIKVEGEEDLATLLCVILSNTGNLIAWGVPEKGVGLLRVSGKKRLEAIHILKQMKRS